MPNGAVDWHDQLVAQPVVYNYKYNTCPRTFSLVSVTAVSATALRLDGIFCLGCGCPLHSKAPSTICYTLRQRSGVQRVAINYGPIIVLEILIHLQHYVIIGLSVLHDTATNLNQ